MVFSQQKTHSVTTGRRSTLDLSLGEWTKTIWDQAISDPWVSIGFGAQNARNIAEAEDYGVMISPEEANRTFGIPDGPLPLQWDKPVNNQRAAMEREMRLAEMRRMAIINSSTHDFLSLKAAGTLVSTLAAGLSHPVDVAAAFFPVVGSAQKARQMARAGHAAWRVRMMRGLITSEERIANTVRYFPRLTSSIVDASVGEAVYQIPNFIREMGDTDLHRAWREYAESIGMAGVGGAALRGALETTARALPFARDLYLRFGAKLKDDLGKKGANDLLNDQSIKLEEIAGLADEVLLESAKWDLDQARVTADMMAAAPAERADIWDQAAARVAREGSLGRVNRNDLVGIVQRQLKHHKGGELAQTDQIQILRVLLEKYENAAAKSASLKKIAPNQPVDPTLKAEQDAILKAMANVLNLVFDPSVKAGPLHYRLGEALIFEPQRKNTKTDYNAVAEGMARLERAQARLAAASAQLSPGPHTEISPNRRQRLEMEREEAIQEIAAAEGWMGTEGRFWTQNIRDAVQRYSEKRDEPQIIEIANRMRAERAQAFLEKLRQEALQTGRAAAIAKQQAQGRRMAENLVKEYILDEAPSQRNLSMVEADVKSLEETLQFEDKIVVDAMEGKANAKAEDAYNAKRLEDGKPPVDFELLRRLGKETEYEDRSESVTAAYGCMKGKIE